MSPALAQITFQGVPCSAWQKLNSWGLCSAHPKCMSSVLPDWNHTVGGSQHRLVINISAAVEAFYRWTVLFFSSTMEVFWGPHLDADVLLRGSRGRALMGPRAVPLFPGWMFTVHHLQRLEQAQNRRRTGAEHRNADREETMGAPGVRSL